MMMRVMQLYFLLKIPVVNQQHTPTLAPHLVVGAVVQITLKTLMSGINLLCPPTDSLLLKWIVNSAVVILLLPSILETAAIFYLFKVTMVSFVFSIYHSQALAP